MLTGNSNVHNMQGNVHYELFPNQLFPCLVKRKMPEFIALA